MCVWLDIRECSQVCVCMCVSLVDKREWSQFCMCMCVCECLCVCVFVCERENEFDESENIFSRFFSSFNLSAHRQKSEGIYSLICIAYCKILLEFVKFQFVRKR